MTIAVDPPLTADDLRDCGWNEVLARSERQGYLTMHSALASASRDAETNGRMREAASLALLAAASSMMLRPDSINEPFSPLFQFGDKRSRLPQDFESEHLEILGQVAAEIPDPWLRARLADLAWFAGEPRDYKLALLAIDAYKEIPLNPEVWSRGGKQCLERAIQLATLLRKAAHERLAQIEADVTSALLDTTPESGFFAGSLSDLLLDVQLGRATARAIAVHLSVHATHFESSRNFNNAQQYFDRAAKWFLVARDEDSSLEMTRGCAEAFAKEADVRLSGAPPNNIAAAALFEKAIHAYRRIPAVKRAAFDTDRRVAELHRLFSEANKRSQEDMVTISTPGEDISNLIDASREAVSGRDSREGLRAFIGLYPGARVSGVRLLSEKILREHPLQSLFSRVMLSHDGRVVAKRQGGSLSSADSDLQETTLWAKMVEIFTQEVSLVVQGCLWPALQVLLEQHRFDERDLTSLAAESPIVPPMRHLFFGRGLFAGFNLDFVSAIHLLVPQVEHLVRWQLKQSGVRTTTLDSEGVETEIGLSALVTKPEVDALFGPDLSFELRALLADSFGPNLRNEVAHGLVEWPTCHSHSAVYLWWWCLRLVSVALFRKEPDSGTTEGSARRDSRE